MSQAQLIAAHQAMQAGRLDEARRLLEPLAEADGVAAHMLALACRRQGDLQRAETWFAQAQRQRPLDPEIENNWGNLKLAQGLLPEAIAAFRRAVALKPGMGDALYNLGLALLEAGEAEEASAALEQAGDSLPGRAAVWSALARACRSAGRHGDGIVAAERALAIDASYAPARVARALLAADVGEPDAVGDLDRLLEERPADRGLVLAAAAARMAAGDRRGVDMVAASVAADPLWKDGQAALLDWRYQAGEGEAAMSGLEAALDRYPTDPGLLGLLANKGADVVGPGRVLARIDRALDRGGDEQLQAVRAEYLLKLGDLDAAQRALALLPRAIMSEDAAISTALVRARVALAGGNPQVADGVLDELRRQWPGASADMGMWALTHTAWRLLGDRCADWLEGGGGLWRQHDLGLSEPGLMSLAERLRQLHLDRHHPAAQSLRNGSQTSGPLLARSDPELVELRDRLQECWEVHRRELPPALAGHPTLDPAVRDRGWRVAGSWSVRLTDGGWHVAHVHPRGRISSACHIVLPPGPGGELILGKPPPELRTGLAPLATFVPAPGHLVLFPSWLWHETAPFSAGERLSVAFDLVPA